MNWKKEIEDIFISFLIVTAIIGVFIGGNPMNWKREIEDIFISFLIVTAIVGVFIAAFYLGVW